MLRCPFTVCNKSINQATRKALLCAKDAPSKMITKNKILCHSIVYMPEAPGVRSRQQRKFARKNRCKWKGLIGIKHILAWLHRLDIISSPLRHYYLLFISSILDSNKVQLSVGSKKKKKKTSAARCLRQRQDAGVCIMQSTLKSLASPKLPRLPPCCAPIWLCATVTGPTCFPLQRKVQSKCCTNVGSSK